MNKRLTAFLRKYIVRSGVEKKVKLCINKNVKVNKIIKTVLIATLNFIMTFFLKTFNPGYVKADITPRSLCCSCISKVSTALNIKP